MTEPRWSVGKLVACCIVAVAAPLGMMLVLDLWRAFG